MGNKSISVSVDGVKFLSVGRYYDDGNDLIAHRMKDGDLDALEYAAKRMASFIPADAVLVPIPGHLGYAKETKVLAEAIGRNANVGVEDLLHGKERETQYSAKKNGRCLGQEEFGFVKTAPVPEGKLPVLVDNVVDTGTTALAAINALGGGMVLSFAICVSNMKRRHGKKMALHE